MGFVRSRIFKITWDEGTDLAGLEIRARAVSMGQFLEFQEYADKIDDGDTDAIKQIMAMFAGVLVSWNLETQDDEDAPPVPVPPTLESLYAQDLEFALAVILKWMDVAAGVTDDLGKESTSTERFPEGSIPMEALSVDLSKLVAQSYS